MRKAEVPFAMLEQTEIYRRELEAARVSQRQAAWRKERCVTICATITRRVRVERQAGFPAARMPVPGIA